MGAQSVPASRASWRYSHIRGRTSPHAPATGIVLRGRPSDVRTPRVGRQATASRAQPGTGPPSRIQRVRWNTRGGAELLDPNVKCDVKGQRGPPGKPGRWPTHRPHRLENPDSPRLVFARADRLVPVEKLQSRIGGAPFSGSTGPRRPPDDRDAARAGSVTCVGCSLAGRPGVRVDRRRRGRHEAGRTGPPTCANLMAHPPPPNWVAPPAAPAPRN